MKNAPQHVRFAAYVLLINMAAFSVSRLVFWRAFHLSAPSYAAGDLIRAFWLGFKFDLRLSLLLVLPILVLGWIPTLNVIGSRRSKFIWLACLVTMELLLVIFYFFDFYYYLWEHSRLTAAVIEHFLAGPAESVRMVAGAYHVTFDIMGIVVFLALFGLILSRIITRLNREPRHATSLAAKAAFYIPLFLIYSFGVYGKFSWFPLRWSEAFFSPNYFVSALSLNPVLYFFDTWPTRSVEYSEKEVRKNYDEVAEFLGVVSPDPDKLSFVRHVQPAGIVPDNTNVVIIVIESLSAFKTGAMGNPLEATPNFDRIAAESMLFKSFFVGARSTARAIFTLITGIPDVGSGRTSSRNPRAVNQHTILNAFKGHDKLYFYNGNLNWANIRGVLTYNIPALRLFEEDKYESPRVDVWGISDFDLFEEVNRNLKACGDKPFIAIVQTAGDHSPFTIPSHKGEFKELNIDEKTLRANGFDSLEEFNSTRFSDYSLGHFFEIAGREKYFNKTIFCILGDHGTHAAGNNLLAELGLTAFQVPFAIYGPALIRGGQVTESVVSSTDVLPTIAGILGVPYTNTTLGRDMLQLEPERNRYAFMAGLGLVGNEFFLLHPKDGSYHLFQIHSTNPIEDVSDKYPGQKDEMIRLYTGLYETSRYMLYHNHD